jgi:leucine dehydrogenase
MNTQATDCFICRKHRGEIVIPGGAMFGVGSLNPGGFNRQRATETVLRIYETTEKVIALAKEQGVPTYRAADLLAEQRIAMVRQVKSLRTKGDT